MFSLKNKSAVITGAGSGIGKAVALLFAQQQAFVHLVDLNDGALKQVAEEIKKNNGKSAIHICDVSRQSTVKDVFQKIGRIDIIVNSAGISHIGRADTTNEEDFDRIYQV